MSTSGKKKVGKPPPQEIKYAKNVEIQNVVVLSQVQLTCDICEKWSHIFCEKDLDAQLQIGTNWHVTAPEAISQLLLAVSALFTNSSIGIPSNDTPAVMG